MKRIGILVFGLCTAAGQACAKDQRLDSTTPESRAAFLCLAYGQGFVAVPGTDTCVRAGGELEAAILSSRLSSSGARPKSGRGRDALAAPSRPSHGHGFTRTYGGTTIEFESHTPTDYGSIDTHIEVQNWQPLSR